MGRERTQRNRRQPRKIRFYARYFGVTVFPTPVTRLRIQMTFLQQNWMLVFTMFVAGGMLLWPIVQARTSGMAEIGTLRATHLLNNNNPVMLDVREPREFTEVKVRDALHLPLSQLKDRIDQVAKDKSRPVIVVDGKGMRGRGAGALLKKAGYNEIYMLSGGLQAWRDAGLPVEKV